MSSRRKVPERIGIPEEHAPVLELDGTLFRLEVEKLEQLKVFGFHGTSPTSANPTANGAAGAKRALFCRIG